MLIVVFILNKHILIQALTVLLTKAHKCPYFIQDKKIIGFVLKLRSWIPNLVWISYEYIFEIIEYEGCMDLDDNASTTLNA
jgi:hypothetical protein